MCITPELQTSYQLQTTEHYPILNRNIDTPSLDITYRQSQSRQQELVKDYQAKSVIGKPRVYPKYGDIPGTWALGTTDAKKFIEVEFKQAIYIQKIDIYETYHTGGVKTISARKPNTDNKYEVIWQTKSVTNMKSSRIFSPDFKRLSFPCKVLKIDVDCTASKSWVEIDAIKITGKRQSCLPSGNPTRIEQWVSKVTSYSSQYSDKKWSASKAIGPHTVYPKYDDIPEAWAQKTRNCDQYIEVSFPKKIYIERILIHETYHAGGVVSVYAKPPNAKLINPNQVGYSHQISHHMMYYSICLSVTTDEIITKLDKGTGKSQWVEIDDVKIIGTTKPGPQINPVQYEHPTCQPNPQRTLQQWVSRVVNYSSQYDDRSVYPKYGDIPDAWAQKTKDANQFVEVKFAEKIFIEKIDIYETYHAGDVKKILAKRPNGEWYTVWKTTRSFIQKTKLTFRCNVLWIDVDCTASRSWVEIDAIKISGTKFNFDMPPAHNDITNDFAKLVNNPVFSDIQFGVNGVKFLAHRAILFVRSEYFRAKFNFDKNGLKPQSPIILKSRESGVFAVVLHYVYTNRLPPFCSTHVLQSVCRSK
ncbi:unnamed protein product [Mytilus coruscus]|uniref:BTB domain-containing protein n=1 Tax=Mytilus coruscus TaxID=42192 RepID=A0A6J8C0H8_MYTCO|nr:unnamed protein product [Mytilus coruscus]